MKEEKIKEAINFLDNYKEYFHLNEDDLQELLIKFHLHYNPDKGEVSTFLVPIIHNHNRTKWRKERAPKHAHTPVYLDKERDLDTVNWIQGIISTNDESFEIYTNDKRNEDVIKEVMTTLNENQRNVITKYYFDEMTLGEIAKERGISRQAVQQTISSGINKIKKYLINNDINVSF